MPGKPTGTASFSGLWVLLYAIQALAGEARVAGSISGAGGNLPCFMGWAKIVSMTGLVLDTGDYPGFAPALRADRYIDIEHPHRY
jgi:hypothetical protein